MAGHKLTVIRQMTEQQKEWFKNLGNHDPVKKRITKSYYKPNDICEGLGIESRTFWVMIKECGVRACKASDFDSNKGQDDTWSKYAEEGEDGTDSGFKRNFYTIGQVMKLKDYYKNKG